MEQLKVELTHGDISEIAHKLNLWRKDSGSSSGSLEWFICRWVKDNKDVDFFEEERKLLEEDERKKRKEKK